MINKLLHKLPIILLSIFILVVFNFATCKYGFKDQAPIPPEVKTFRVNYLDNKAQYVNTQFSPLLTDKLRQKIINTTRLRGTNSDDAHFDISGWVTQYYLQMVSLTNNTNTGNRLNVGFHLIFKNTLDDSKSFEADLTRAIDVKGELTQSDVDRAYTTEMVNSLVDEIFNKIFSNW